MSDEYIEVDHHWCITHDGCEQYDEGHVPNDNLPCDRATTRLPVLCVFVPVYVKASMPRWPDTDG